MLDFNTALSIPVLFAIIQIILDLFLIGIVLFLLRRIAAFDPVKFTTLIDTLRESRELCEKLETTVMENAAVADNINRILTRPTGDAATSAPCSSAEHGHGNLHRHEQVSMLWKQGRTIEDIADITGLGKGEIEVLTALAAEKAGDHAPGPA